jgi:hypothetical protein
MKRPTIFALVLAATGVVIAILTIAALFFGRTEAGAAQASRVTFTVDSDTYAARKKDLADGTFVVEIIDAASGAALITGSVPANPAMRWIIEEHEGIVWFYSGDIGMFLYIRADDGAWREVDWIPASAESRQHRIPEVVYSKLSSGRQEDLEPWREEPD